MSVNRYQDYLIVLFEDNAYKDLFLGFEFSLHKQVVQKPIFQGFDDVLFQLTHLEGLTLKELKQYAHAYVLAMIDADLDSQSHSKIDTLKNAIADEFKDRIFVVGAKYEAEHIKQAIIGNGKWASVAKRLETSCQNDDCRLWQDEQLQHNINEMVRLQAVFNLWTAY